MKTLDTTLKTNTDDGKVGVLCVEFRSSLSNDFHQSVSLTKKCADMDKEIPEMMQVSKAILENVIFCHQEDSGWPLGAPKVLHSRFVKMFYSSGSPSSF